jgi:curli biogenesis system outer membrane secretion channel CsgG
LFARGDGGLGAARGTSLNVVALDLNVLRTADMSVVSGVSSKNSIAIFERGNSLNADASMNKFGIYFDVNLNRNEGQAQAMRNLVELAAIETIGKLVNVPYERCL